MNNFATITGVAGIAVGAASFAYTNKRVGDQEISISNKFKAYDEQIKELQLMVANLTKMLKTSRSPPSQREYQPPPQYSTQREFQSSSPQREPQYQPQREFQSSPSHQSQASPPQSQPSPQQFQSSPQPQREHQTQQSELPQREPQYQTQREFQPPPSQQNDMDDDELINMIAARAALQT